MTYNLTAINATNSTLGFFQQINELTSPSRLLGNGWSIVLFVVIFFYVLYYTNDMRKGMLAAGTLSFLITGLFFLAAQLVSWWIVVAYLSMAILGIILLLDKDYSG